MKREIWCDHCQTRFEQKGGLENPIAVCRRCKGVTLVVTCHVCGEYSEIAQPAASDTWCCPTCKDERYYQAGVLGDFFSAESAVINIQTPSVKKVREHTQDDNIEFAFGCIVTIASFLLCTLLESCVSSF